MYKVDDLVVYPAQGVGKINRIDSQKIGGVPCDFYIVRIQSNNITLMVPVKNAQNVGLRHLVDRKKAKAILDGLTQDTDKPVYVGQNWNRRFREYSDKMKSKDLEIVADVLRELLIIGRDKELSYGERRLQEQAMSLVTGEIAEVLGLAEHDIKDKLREIYAPPVEEDEPEEATETK